MLLKPARGVLSAMVVCGMVVCLSSVQGANEPWKPTGQETPASMKAGTHGINRPKEAGSYYEATVPDTLDLAERARLGLNHLTSVISAKDDYEMVWNVRFEESNPPLPHFQLSPLFACQAKYLEAMAMLRLMSGSQQNLELEAKMMEMLISHIGEEGIYWVMPSGGRKPWLGSESNRPYAQVHGQGDMMHAMIAWYQYTGNPRWKELIDRMVDGVDRLMLARKKDYAYFPVHGIMPEEYFRSCYVKGRGWKDTEEPSNEKAGEEGSLFVHQGRIAEALANWSVLTGNKQALRMSGQLVRFYMQPKFWADNPGGDYPGVVGAEHAHWQGHYHGYVGILQGIMAYAKATNDARLKAFVRDGYEWTRQAWLARIGFVGDGQGCGLARLIKLAIMLSDAGVGDYWEDVDLYVRNYQAESQFTPDDIPYLEMVGKGKSRPTTATLPLLTGPYDFSVNRDKVFEMSMGAFCQDPLKANWYGCCSPWGNMGLHFAWDATLRRQDGVVRVNLLLNRASPWMDIESELPYQGKVILRNKKAREAFVRIPLYVEKNEVKCRIGGQEIPLVWFGRYLHLKNLNPADVIIIEFPEKERIEQYTTPATQREYKEFPGDVRRTYRFKGNTLIEILPPWPGVFQPEWHQFQGRREQFAANQASRKTAIRYITPARLEW